MGAADLSSALESLPSRTDPRLVVGRETFDDAGIFRISDDVALVQTVDFFAPIVDDPYDYGQIAAANALSDVYAMGGQPLTALNIVSFPTGELPLDVLIEILRGGQDKVHEAGAFIVGGHTVIGELKYGLSVTGQAHPSFLLTNAGAKPGDRLVLTKPIGTGILTTAAKRQMIQPDEHACRARRDENPEWHRESRGPRRWLPLRDGHHGIQPARPRLSHRAGEPGDTPDRRGQRARISGSA